MNEPQHSRAIIPAPFGTLVLEASDSHLLNIEVKIETSGLSKPRSATGFVTPSLTFCVMRHFSNGADGITNSILHRKNVVCRSPAFGGSALFGWFLSSPACTLDVLWEAGAWKRAEVEGPSIANDASPMSAHPSITA